MISNCLFLLNVSGTGAVYGDADSAPVICNSTFSQNTAFSGGAVCCENGHMTINNCILWGNGPDEIHLLHSAQVVVSHSNVQGGWVGTGNIYGIPLFVDPDGPDNDPETWEDSNYRLLPGSPCIDAADNAAVPPDVFDLDGDGDVDEPIPFDLDGNPRFVDDPDTPDSGLGDPPIVDMGAYEFRTVVPGDTDCDGDVDFDDIDPFVLALGGQAAYEAAYPDCNWWNADCNDDASVDFDDIDPFVAILSGG